MSSTPKHEDTQFSEILEEAVLIDRALHRVHRFVDDYPNANAQDNERLRIIRDALTKVAEDLESKRIVAEREAYKEGYRTGVISELKKSELIRQAAIKETMEIFTIHKEGEGDYCDTGSDMDWACRSRCVELALKRLNEKS